MRRLVFLFGAIVLPWTSSASDRVPEDFATIQEAVDQGTSGVIEVGPGSWSGAILTRSVRIVGHGASIVDGPTVGPVRAGFPLTAAASSTEISGFTFDCRGSLDAGVYGSTPRLGAANGVTVAHNTFRGCVQGVTNAGTETDECRPAAVDGGAYWLIHDNQFRDFATRTARGASGGGIGILLFNTVAADVYGNAFSGRVDDRADFTTGGITLAGCIDCTVVDNRFEVAGGQYYWAAVSNLGFYRDGGAASENLLVADNDAARDSAPHRGVNFRSYDSFHTELDNNRGRAVVDHSWCGDDVVALAP